MAAPVPGPDPSERIFVELRSRNEEVKLKAAVELRELVTLLSRGMTVRNDLVAVADFV